MDGQTSVYRYVTGGGAEFWTRCSEDDLDRVEATIMRMSDTSRCSYEFLTAPRLSLSRQATLLFHLAPAGRA